MTLEKLKRIAAAVTSSAILLLFILVSVMVYQIATIHGKKAEIKNLEQEIVRLEQEKEDKKSEIDIWLSDWKIEETARKLGYVYKGDK